MLGEIRPSLETFKAECAKAEYAKGCFITFQRSAETETPMSALLKLKEHFEGVMLLESVAGGVARARHSLIALDPDLLWRYTGEQAELYADGVWQAQSEPPLESLRACLAQSTIHDRNWPSMIGGWYGYLGYDTVRHLETLPGSNPASLDVPDGVMMRPQVTVLFDHVADTITLATPIWPGTVTAAEAATCYEAAVERLYRLCHILDAPLPAGLDLLGLQGAPQDPVSEMSSAGFCAMVERAQAYIKAGDIFQVVLSQRYLAPFVLPALDFYRALRRLNPSPYLMYMDFGSFQIAGSSPEILVKVEGDTVTIRPIAGTRPRGGTPEEEARLEADLLSDPKELAEHLMLLDLGRNDVGRVSQPATVEVSEQFFIERYSHVIHIVSHVTGKLKPDLDALDALLAGLPAGTVSGAPKIRAMEIIEELESTKRSVYAGGVGYLAANGDLDMCIALRTAVVKDGMLHIQAGAGIVADSVPEDEDAECRYKAQALFKAAEEAYRQAKRKNRPG